MNLMGKRIAVGGFMHETNTFQPQKTSYTDFAEAGGKDASKIDEMLAKARELVTAALSSHT